MAWLISFLLGALILGLRVPTNSRCSDLVAGIVVADCPCRVGCSIYGDRGVDRVSLPPSTRAALPLDGAHRRGSSSLAEAAAAPPRHTHGDSLGGAANSPPLGRGESPRSDSGLDASVLRSGGLEEAGDDLQAHSTKADGELGVGAVPVAGDLALAELVIATRIPGHPPVGRVLRRSYGRRGGRCSRAGPPLGRRVGRLGGGAELRLEVEELLGHLAQEARGTAHQERRA